MRAPARVQAAIDLLDAIIVASRDGGASADSIAKNYFRTRRYMGSKDRRAVREHCYAVIRSTGNLPQSGREAMIDYARQNPELALLFDGSQYGPAPIGAAEQSKADAKPPHGASPDWLMAHLPEWLDSKEQAALFERAPLDIRMHNLSADELSEAFPDAQFDDRLPTAARLAAGTQLAAHELWRAGKLDVQDMGSQYIVAACNPQQHKTMIDLCAGAGGKALGLAASAQGAAHILACDTSRSRLSELPHRAHRLGIDNIQSLLLDPGKEMSALSNWVGKADLVLVDAPCSGTGTWRRNPETRWRLNPARLERLKDLQKHILDYAEQLVKPGGNLVYAVCSLLPEEGPLQIEQFLAANAGWTVDVPDVGAGRTVSGKSVHNRESAQGIVLSPYLDKTDGFFFTRLKKPC